MNIYNPAIKRARDMHQARQHITPKSKYDELHGTTNDEVN